MTPVKLYAKKPGSRDETIPAHTKSVFEATLAIFEFFENDIKKCFGLSEEDFQTLKKVCIVASILHDIGKANSHFLKQILSDKFVRQAIRHEVMTIWILSKFPDVLKWLNLSETEEKLVVRTIVNHHIKVSNHSECGWNTEALEKEMTVYCGHEDIRQCLMIAKEYFGLPDPPVLKNLHFKITADMPFDEDDDGNIRIINKTVQPLLKKLTSDEERNLGNICLDLVMCADGIASGFGEKPASEKSMSCREYFGLVNAKRCKKEEFDYIVAKGLKGNKIKRFQKAGRRAGKNRATLLISGTGSGKTVFSYVWAGVAAEGMKLFFNYPTTGTATEGGKYMWHLADYVLLHSKWMNDMETTKVEREKVMAAYAKEEEERLEKIDEAVTEAKASPFDKNEKSNDDYAMIYGKGRMLGKVMATTLDQTFGHVQHWKSNKYSSIAMMIGAQIFDEVHS